MGEDLECRQKPKRLELTYNDQMKIRMFCNPNWSISAPPSEPDHKPVQSNSRKDLHNPKGKSNGKMKRQHTCSRWQQREPVPMKRQMPAHPMMLPPQPPTVSPWARPPPALAPRHPQAFCSQSPPPMVPLQFTSPPPHMFIPPNTPPMIVDETPRFNSVSQNNRIFVDGSVYDVFYVDETALILKNGVPHRIYFTGCHHDIFIDNVPHRLAFGQIKHVMIDGESHRLRFGGPAREFYLNDFPFRGTFGGPAIYGRINGRRHEFRLSGPAPGVSVDPEPSYEFHQMLPSMQNMLTPPPNMATPLPKFEPKEEPAQTPPASDIFSFLRKLQKQGVLQATPPSESPKTASPPVEAVSPFNSGFGAPPENLFNNAQLLGVRYRSVVDSILKPTIVSCKECGLSYEDISEELRTRHRDDHVKEKLKRLKSATSGESRTWFPTKNKSFYECSIRAELLQSAHKKEQAKNGAPAATNTVVPSDSVEQKHCQACLEKFDEIYDDDEDVWMLKDSTLFQDKPYHTRCIDDA